jgi:ribokinase
MGASLAVIGSFVQDLAFQVAEFPASGQTIIGEFFTGPGGKGSNQAVAAHRQGVPTLFIGAVGDDIFGKGYRTWCEQERLPTSLLSVPGMPTGAASIVINRKAHNAIVVALGANDALSSEHVLASLIREPDLRVLLLQAESNLDAAQSALTYARSKGLYSLFNPAPINPGVSSDLLALADCITPNETEFAFLVERVTGKPFLEDVTQLSDASIRELCAHIPASAVLITIGEKGSILCQQKEPPSQVQDILAGDVVRTPAIPVKPLDTTGAGDAFNGGLAAGIVLFNGAISRAIRYATVVAGLSTEKLGTAPAMPTRAEVEQHCSFYE